VKGTLRHSGSFYVSADWGGTRRHPSSTFQVLKTSLAVCCRSLIVQRRCQDAARCSKRRFGI